MKVYVLVLLRICFHEKIRATGRGSGVKDKREGSGGEGEESE